LSISQSYFDFLSAKKTIFGERIRIYIVFEASVVKSLRELLAYNMKVNRGRLGLSQAKLAERSGLSTQYIAMIELTRKFPSPEMLEKIAKALEIDPPGLFSMPTAEGQVRELQKTVLLDLEKAVTEAVAQVIERNLERLEVGEDCD
jgi:transcriptional regulator with XRE-family HTH domain